MRRKPIVSALRSSRATPRCAALPSAASLRWHYAAALVAERAIRAVNRVNLRSLARLDELVALAVLATHPSLTGDVPTLAGRASSTEGPR